MFNQDRKNVSQNMDAFVEERLSDYLDGNLSDRERAMVEAHLAASERARASLESLRYTVNLLKQTPAPALPRQFTLPVTAHAPAQRASGWLVWGLRGVAVAATAAFVVLLTAIVLRPPFAYQTASAPVPPLAVVAALRPTQTPLSFAAQAPVNKNSSSGPLMITVVAPPATEIVPAPIPITETPAAQRKAANALATATQLDQPPSASVPKTAASESAQLAPTETVVKPMVSAAGANPNAGTTPVPGTAIADAATESATGSLPFIQGIILVDDLRVRRGPGIEFRQVGVLKQGDKVNVVGRTADEMWLIIEYPKNTETGLGWIGTPYVQVNDSIDTLPIMEPPAPGKPQIKATPDGLLTPTPAP